MKKNIFLAACISMALNANVNAQDPDLDDDVADLGTVVITGPNYERTPPI